MLFTSLSLTVDAINCHGSSLKGLLLARVHRYCEPYVYIKRHISLYVYFQLVLCRNWFNLDRIMSSSAIWARVYADVNTHKPREYWDYESHPIEWGSVNSITHLQYMYSVLIHTHMKQGSASSSTYNASCVYLS